LERRCALDIVIPDRESNKVIYGQNDGSGNFTLTEILTGFDASKVFIADINGDKMNDIVVTSFNGGPGVTWLENLGSGNF
jgi:hypothetical protein